MGVRVIGLRSIARCIAPLLQREGGGIYFTSRLRWHKCTTNARNFPYKDTSEASNGFGGETRARSGGDVVEHHWQSDLRHCLKMQVHPYLFFSLCVTPPHSSSPPPLPLSLPLFFLLSDLTPSPVLSSHLSPLLT
jgi:hypothetical protein